MRSEVVLCDVCGVSNAKGLVMESIKISVIFTTEQTEGRPIDPHLSIEKVDLCQGCLDKILQGNMLFGSGAQGNNTYQFKFGV